MTTKKKEKYIASFMKNKLRMYSVLGGQGNMK